MYDRSILRELDPAKEGAVTVNIRNLKPFRKEDAFSPPEAVIGPSVPYEPPVGARHESVDQDGDVEMEDTTSPSPSNSAATPTAASARLRPTATQQAPTTLCVTVRRSGTATKASPRSANRRSNNSTTARMPSRKPLHYLWIHTGLSVMSRRNRSRPPQLPRPRSRNVSAVDARHYLVAPSATRCWHACHQPNTRSDTRFRTAKVEAENEHREVLVGMNPTLPRCSTCRTPGVFMKISSLPSSSVAAPHILRTNTAIRTHSPTSAHALLFTHACTSPGIKVGRLICQPEWRSARNEHHRRHEDEDETVQPRTL